MRILGIDPGIAIVGFGLIEADRGRTQLLNYGAITTPAGLPLARRLVQIEQDMEALIAQLKPDAIAVEELFFSNNITTGIAAASFCARRKRAACRSTNTHPCRSSRPSSAMALLKRNRSWTWSSGS